MSMAKPKIDISKLTLDERIRLMGELWDSLDPDDLGLSDELMAELERRAAEMDRHPERARPWEDVKKELLDRIG